MAPHLLIRWTVIPCLRDLEGWKLHDSHAFGMVALKLLERRIADDVLGLVAQQGGPDLLPLGF
jgi:hypothetical protein